MNTTSTIPDFTHVGFIGLGMMGMPMVENLTRTGGLDVVAHDALDTHRATLQGWSAWGRHLHWAESLEGLARCGLVITMLPNSGITNGVVARLLPLLARGAVVVDMGSSNPADTQALANDAAARGIEFVDAPVSGSVAKARTGELSIMLGGSDAAIERIDAVMRRMGSKLIRTGAVGSAHAMKALNNYVYAAGLLAMAEAVTVASKAGLDLDVFASVLNASSGRNVATETKLTQFVIPRTFNGGFQLRLQAKDIATARELASRCGVRTPQMVLCEDLWRQAVQTLEPGADNTTIVRFIENLA
ncbi:NAD(P)-dependent oxidoreductase [Hydrogenophaga sp.]|uniref:NAD(P)-dependent oxidoreductase n=1 Tax=Hydrogenophaga sp. TaxID=1904254 RepID=UPI002604DBFE|nr:NAD(P)-dependent oxidoreductase [Hydrogenophaga sp.]MCW5654469.1 NAD(P)-dependent oxidoreductase [Hydrogenophaga sp.]